MVSSYARKFVVCSSNDLLNLSGGLWLQYTAVVGVEWKTVYPPGELWSSCSSAILRCVNVPI